VGRHTLVDRIRKRVSKGSKLAQLAQLLAVIVSTLNLVFLIGIGLVLSQADFWELFFGLPRVAIALLYIPPITTGLTFLLPILIALNWKHKYWSGIERLHYILITLAAIGFVSFLDYWNLLGFRF
jgi:hypothetical protein